MNIYPVIIDSRPAYLSRCGEASSLLLSPMGRGTLLDYFRQCLKKYCSENAIILTTFDADLNYKKSLRAFYPKADTILPCDHLEQLSARYEPSDRLLFIDSSRLVMNRSFIERLLVCQEEMTPVRNLVISEPHESQTCEHAILTHDGTVRRIQRYYRGVTWHRVSNVVSSLISISALQLLGQKYFSTLMEARTLLTSIGLPNQDIVVSEDTFDLKLSQHLRECNEWIIGSMLLEEKSHGHSSDDFIWKGKSSVIEPGVTCHGPVVVQDGAVIEEGSTLIGPALIGTGAKISRSSVVAQALIMPNSTVQEKTTIRHCVYQSEDESLKKSASISAFSTFSLQPESHLSKSSKKNRKALSVYSFVKRIIDLAFTIPGLILVSPILLFAAVLVKTSSKGNIFFGHLREGCSCKSFKCWKFRTMSKDAHLKQRLLFSKNQVDGPQFKIEDDPRITSVGRWLRRTNIDELPQLFNVLKGQMSLIGPRPSPFRENQICVPWRQARLSVRPGITGLWQVCRHERSAGDFHQWIHYDMLYVKNMSFALDMKILMATLLTLGGRWSVPLSWMIKEPQVKESLFMPSFEALPMLSYT